MYKLGIDIWYKACISFCEVKTTTHSIMRESMSSSTLNHVVTK